MSGQQIAMVLFVVGSACFLIGNAILLWGATK